MKKYRRTSLPDERQPLRSPIPWTSKLLIGVVAALAVLFLALIVMRADRWPLINRIVDKLSSHEMQTQTALPVSAVTSPVLTPTFPPGSAWLMAIKITRIFTGPGEENASIGILEGGNRAKIVGKSPDGDWWAIRVPYVEGEVGWVNDAQVQSYDTSAVTILADIELSPEASPTPAPDRPKVQAIANTNVRSGPGLEYERIGLLQPGQEADILGKDPQEFWWLIKIAGVEGERGWVARDYVIAQNANDVPTIGTSSIQFGAIPTPAPGAPSLASTMVVNIRAGPGMNYAIIGKLAPDQKVEVVGVSPDGGWWAIKIPAAQNQRGWISSQYVKVENAGGVPVLR